MRCLLWWGTLHIPCQGATGTVSPPEPHLRAQTCQSRCCCPPALYQRAQGPLSRLPALCVCDSSPQGHHTSPCLEKKNAFPFSSKQRSHPGAISMSHFHNCFGGRFGKIHEEPLPPFSCTLLLLSGVYSALALWGLLCSAMGTSRNTCLTAGKVGMLKDGLCVLGDRVWDQLWDSAAIITCPPHG